MNKKLLITQRPQQPLLERSFCNHASRHPHSRDKEPFKPSDQWNFHQTNTFSHRHRAEPENRYLCDFIHQRAHSSHQPSPSERLNHPPATPPHSKQEVDLLALVSELAKINTETQERLSDLTGRINRLEHSFNEFKGLYRGELESKMQKSFEQLYDIINRDFKASEDNIISHVREMRSETKAATLGKLEELTSANEQKYTILSKHLQQAMKKDMQKLKEGLQHFKADVQANMNTLDLRECLIDRSRTCRTTAVRFACAARSEHRQQPLSILEYTYYVTDEGHLTDEHGYHITDCKGQHISLTKDHLQKLKQAGILITE